MMIQTALVVQSKTINNIFQSHVYSSYPCLWCILVWLLGLKFTIDFVMTPGAGRILCKSISPPVLSFNVAINFDCHLGWHTLKRIHSGMLQIVTLGSLTAPSQSSCLIVFIASCLAAYSIFYCHWSQLLVFIWPHFPHQANMLRLGGEVWSVPYLLPSE